MANPNPKSPRRFPIKKPESMSVKDCRDFVQKANILLQRKGWTDGDASYQLGIRKNLPLQIPAHDEIADS